MERAKRVVAFSDITNQFKLRLPSGYVISELPIKRQLDCAMKCLKTPECKSYSFCHRFCSLNSIGFSELQQKKPHIVARSSNEICDLFSMERNFIPQCQEFGSVRSIRDDSDPNYCAINKKRVDGAFLEREYFNASIDTDEEFKGFTTKKCLPDTTLNGGFCKSENETQEVWVKWKDEWLNYSQSAEVCKNFGGILFPDLDGDGKQIEFLKRFTDRFAWLGVEVDTKWFIWKNLRGERLYPDRVRWEIFEDEGFGNVARTHRFEPFIKNISPSLGGKPVCQMIV